MEADPTDRHPIGAVAGLVGAALALLGLGLRPLFLDLDTRGVLEQIAAHGTWSELHLLLAAAVVLVSVGLIDVARSASGIARSLASVSRTVVLVGAPIAATAMLIDAVARQPAARAWVDAEPGQEAAAFLAADAVDHLWYAAFAGWVLLLLGAAPVLLGLAQWRAGHPVWLAAAAVVGGTGGVLIGTALVVAGGSDELYLALGAASTVVLGWLAVSSARSLRDLRQPR